MTARPCDGDGPFALAGNVVSKGVSTELTQLAAGNADYFVLMGLARGFDLDVAELRRRYLEIHRRIHPDALAGQSEAVREAGLAAASRVNEAYETLRDPVRRAEYLLVTSGGKSAAEDKRVPPEVLTQTLMLREEIEEIRAAGGDAERMAAIRREVLEQKGEIEGRIAELARRVARGGTDGDRDELRLELNAIKYSANLLSQL